MERRFQAERFTEAVIRVRVTMAACALVSAALGLYEVYNTNLYVVPGLVMKLHVARFYGVVAVWLGLFLATFWRGFPRRADTLHAVVIVLSCWGHSLTPWLMVQSLPNINLVNALVGSVILVLVVAVLLLPLRLRTLIVTVILSVGGVSGLFYGTLHGVEGQGYNLRTSVFTLSLVAVLLIAGGWFRESVERRWFWQREQARELAAELTRLNAEKDEFMTIAAHDLRAPLSGVRALLEGMQQGKAVAEPERGRALRTMLDSTRQMTTLVNDYLSVYAAESGQLPVRRAKVDLGVIIAAAGERHAAAAVAKAQQLKVHPTGTPVWVRTDESLLNQIADNFVTNAIKFSPRGARVEVDVQTAVEARLARITVVDTGPGLAPDEVAGLFRKFGRASARPTAGESSTGLGLAVAKRLAEAMDGRVGCESRLGKGSTFWLELPLAE